MFKIKRLLRLCVFFSLCCLPTELFAGVFEIPQTDKSVELLGIIFGSNVGTIYLGGSTSPMLMDMFEKFNIIVISIATVILSYIGIVSTINTAQEGQVMGKKWSSIWIPLRSLIGILLMVPTPGSGYSMIQVTVLWIILQGVGAADQIWNIVLTNLEKGVSATDGAAVEESPETKVGLPKRVNEMTQKILFSAVCMETIKIIAKGTIKDKKGDPIPIDEPIKSSGENIRPYTSKPIVSDDGLTYTNQFNIGVKGNALLDKICGSYEISATVTDAEIDKMPAPKDESAKKAAENAFNKKQLLMSTVFSYLLPNAKALAKQSITNRINDPLSPIYNQLKDEPATASSSYLALARNAYISGIRELIIPEASKGDDAMANVIDVGRKAGWISAGSYYFYLTKGQKGRHLLSTALIPPSLADFPGKKNAKYELICPDASCLKNLKSTNIPLILDNFLDDKLQHFIATILYDTYIFVKNSADKSVNRDLNFKYSGSGDTTKALEPLMDANKNAVLEMQKMLKNSSATDGAESKNATDPLRQIAELGGRLMLGSEIAFFVYLIITAVITWIASGADTKIAGFGVETSTAVLSTFLSITSLVYGMLGVLWIAGASMAIYVPMVPYMIFTLTAIGWMILVIEAIVAAPIFSLAMVIPSGDELGKLVTGIGLLAGILLRPTLMIFGFVLAIRLFRAVVALVNFGMADAIGSIPNSSSLFSGIAVMCFYAGFIIALVNKCFTLIHILPDKVLTWIGVAAQSTGDETIMSAAKGAMESGAKATSDAMGGAASGAAKGAQGTLKDKGDAGKEAASDKKQDARDQSLADKINQK